MADRLSGGQKHQLALAMALATQPKLLILDEPSAGLSPKAVEDMYGVLMDLRTRVNVSILLIEQNVSKAVNYCTKSILIKTGEIVSYVEEGDLPKIESIMFNYE